MLAIAVLGVGLSASEINFAQTPAQGAISAPAAVVAADPAQSLEAAPVQTLPNEAADIEPEETTDSADPLGVSRHDAECLAKIIHHESANQPEQVQLAVAHVVLNRLKSQTSAFPRSICAIALQRGQFFNVHAYNPSRDPRWATSQRIAERAITGEGMRNAPGALFFHTAGHSSQISRSRPRVARLGGMDFYR